MKEHLCRYCNCKLTARGTRGKGVPKAEVELNYCKGCQSEQTFDDKGNPIEYSFMVGHKYCIHYWPKSKAFKIVQYDDGKPAKYVLELTLKEDPDYMTPSSMTEERVKCIVVFS